MNGAAMAFRRYLLPPRCAALCLVSSLLGACNAKAPSELVVPSPEDGGVTEPQSVADATFSVGGSVEGLGGTLLLGFGEEELSIAGNGRFEFQQRLRDDAVYSVAIVEQPDGETCGLERGTGRIQGADVDDVFVQCEAGSVGLLDIALSSGSLEPAFSPERSRYRVDVPRWVTRLAIEPVLADESMRATVAGELYSGSAVEVPLGAGQNTFVVESIPETGPSTQVTLDVYQAPNITERLYAKARIPTEPSQFGYAVSVNGDVFAVGAPGNPSSAVGINGDEADTSAQASGAAYVFTKRGSGWEQTVFIKAHNADSEDLFGTSVALLGDVLVVGAPFEDGSSPGVDGEEDDDLANSGAVYVFELLDEIWTQTAYLKAALPAVGDAFGQSVAIGAAPDGTERIVVGAHHESSDRPGANPRSRNEDAPNTGAVYVFERRSGVFTQTATLKAANAGIGDEFGTAVALFGDTLVAGAPGEQSSAQGLFGDSGNDENFYAGAAYVFTYDADDDSWFQSAYLKPHNTIDQARFGSAVSVHGHTVAVGAFTEPSSTTGIDSDSPDTAADESGAVYVFQELADGADDAPSWEQSAYIKASNSDAGDHFGHRVALHHDTLLVGAHLESGAGPGVDAPENDDSAPGAGAVYVFFREDSRFTQHSIIKASNAGSADNFGFGLAFDGTTLVVGAPHEDNAKGGLDMDGSPNNALRAAGAAYVF